MVMILASTKNANVSSRKVSFGMLQRAHRVDRPRATMSHCSAPDPHAPTPFHLAFPVKDLQESREFYGQALGCTEGRSSARWVDFNLYGHQVVAHVVNGYEAATSLNTVDSDPVPVPHFGLALTIEQFHALSARMKEAKVSFELEPHVRFVGQPGEQWTMFVKDPSGNCLEAMTNPENLFAKYVVE